MIPTTGRRIDPRQNRMNGVSDNASMGPVRRTINLICASALTGVGAYFFVDLFLYAPHAKAAIVVAAGAAMATFLGLHWLWIDFINPEPTPEEWGGALPD